MEVRIGVLCLLTGDCSVALCSGWLSVVSLQIFQSATANQMHARGEQERTWR
jgi:hypothetical protein